MNFYLAALDDRERELGDNPSIGLILCREHNRVVVEYALRGVDAPIGVARYRLLPPGTLPQDLADALPTADELAPGVLPRETAMAYDAQHGPSAAPRGGRRRWTARA